MKGRVILFLLVYSVFYPILTHNNHQSVEAYYTSIEVSGAHFVFDISHISYHNVFDRFIGNLTSAGNTAQICIDDFDLNAAADALFISQPENNFTSDEKQLIKEWLDLGDKLLFISGDSDYGGYYDPLSANGLLDHLGTHIRIDSTSVLDSVSNDGASYRVAAIDYGMSPTASILKDGCDAGIIMHGPCAVLGYIGADYIDLRTSSLPNVEILLSYSENATSDDTDVSNIDTDLYAHNDSMHGINGNYPAVVYEEMSTTSGNDSHVIVAGETIFADYKEMYEQLTETGYYNGGIHYGQKFVNNIVNYFVENSLDQNQIVLIYSDQDLIDYGFPGTGSVSDPYIIENRIFNSSLHVVGIHISGTTKHIYLRDCEFLGFTTSIEIKNITSGAIYIQNNTINDSTSGIDIYDSGGVMIENNDLSNNYNGIKLYNTNGTIIKNNRLEGSTTYAIILDSECDSNEIYFNDFIDNCKIALGIISQARDDGINNMWYNAVEEKGNYWSDWDEEGNYNIDGSAYSVDKFPMKKQVDETDFPLFIFLAV